MDDIKDIGKHLSEGVVEALKRLDERQGTLRDRWFEEDADGVKQVVTEKHELDGEKYDWKRIGMEVPNRIILKRAKSSIKTDFTMEKDKKGLWRLVPRCFAGQDETCEYSLEVEFESAPPAKGLLALHQHAGNQIVSDSNIITEEPQDDVPQDKKKETE